LEKTANRKKNDDDDDLHITTSWGWTDDNVGDGTRESEPSKGQAAESYRQLRGKSSVRLSGVQYMQGIAPFDAGFCALRRCLR
jgi:hypothetical protein